MKPSLVVATWMDGPELASMATGRKSRDREESTPNLSQEGKVPEVISSMFDRVDWEANTLTVTFKGGKVYKHPSVPQAVYNAMMASPSVGKYYNANVKKQFPHSA